jgi:hypothetical protein
MADTTVRNWSELMQALYDIPASSHGRHRSDFVYRGLADASWGLDTSLYRLGGDYRNIERPMLRSFRKYAEPGSIPSENFWVRLSVAQHHGLPTRVLDWTLSPRVALHFATAEEEHYDKDGVIWCLDVVQARDLLPGDLRAVLEREYAWVFSIEMLEFISSMSAFDDLARHGPFLLFFEPPMPGAHLRLSEFLEDHPDVYKRIVISKDIKWEIRDKLDQDNVTERMLFPGLDGLSRWLKRYYGPGSSAARAGTAQPTGKKP